MRCFYGAPQFDTQANVMRKCDGCLDQELESNLRPICVSSCPQRGISSFGLSSMNYGQIWHGESKSRLAASVVHPSNLIDKPHPKARPTGDTEGVMNIREVRHA